MAQEKFQTEAERVAVGLAWYAAAEKQVYEILAKATAQKKLKKSQQHRVRG